MLKSDLFKSIIKTFVILGATTVLFFYAYGFRLSTTSEGENIDFRRTGMVNAKSIPDGANIYIDDILRTATDDTVAGLEPGKHMLKISKSGFEVWQKEIEVFPELVTDITAVLVARSGAIDPLTTTGARYPSISPTLSKLAFFSQDEEEPGIWVIPLTNEGVTFFRSNAVNVLLDTKFSKYSQGTNIRWSPDEKNLLFEGQSKINYLVDINKNTAEAVPNFEIIEKEWEEKIVEKRLSFIEKLDISEEIKELAISKRAVWSPDGKKFLYTNQNDDQLEYKIYNLEKPLPVGEKVETTALVTNINGPQPKITWYSDSFHLILVEGNVLEEKTGSVSIVRIDGSNKTEIFSGVLYGDDVFSSPGGDKVIVWTSFKSIEQSDLFSVRIR